MNLKKSLSLLAMAAAAVSAQTNDRYYSGAELYTRDTYEYGRFEARMQMAAGSGTVSSMFLYHNDSYIGCDEPWVEVDIEILGKNPNEFQSNIITGYGPADGCADRKQYSEKLHPMSPAVNTAFHTYVMEWTPDYVAWIIDGVEVRRTKAGELNSKGADQVVDLKKKPQGLRFNLWSHTDAGWVGPWDDSILPVYQFINWVKVYKYTPGQGENGSDFTLDWVDNFDSFDSSRWLKGNWTFDGNRVYISSKNIYAQDGMMILALTKKGQESFNGVVPQDTEPSPVTSSASQDPSSSASADPASSASEDPSSIKKLTPAAKLQNSRGTFNAKGEMVNKANAARYRVDFKL